MNLIFDLDGTLIDSRPRLYQLFQELVPSSTLTFEAYWGMKRSRTSNEAILSTMFGFNQAAINHFVVKWMELIEAPRFLAVDKVFSRVHEALDRLGTQANLHVCTARQDSQAAVMQLQRLDLRRFFATVMVTEQKRTKRESLEHICDLGPQDWILSDTGSDILVGQELGIKTCAVLSGFLDEESLRLYGADLILPSVAEFQL